MLGLLLIAFVQEPTPQLVHSLGHPRALAIIGADTVGADAVRSALLVDADFFEASMPMQPLAGYLGWLESAVALGYHNAGFIEVQVTARADEAQGEVQLGIVEGARFLAGELVVEGEIRLAEDWVREVLRVGDVHRTLGETATPGRLVETLPLPFWVPGEPAPLSSVDRERFERLVESAVVAAGFLDTETGLRWKRGEGTTVLPVVTVARAGWRSILHDVRFEGDSSESADELRAWAAIPHAAPASIQVRWAVEDRLRATGRFLDVSTHYEDVPDAVGRVVLVVRVVPNPIAPPVAEHPTDDLARLVAAVDRLARQSLDPDAGAVGVSLEVALRPSALATLRDTLEGLGLDLGDGAPARYRLKTTIVQHFALLELVRAQGDDDPTPLLRLWLDAKGSRVHCPPLGLELEFGPTNAEALGYLRGTVKPVMSEAGSFLDLSLSGGIGTKGRARDAPVRLLFDVHPSLLLNFLSRWTIDPLSDAETLRLTFDSDEVRARLAARRDGTHLVAIVDMDLDGAVATFTLGDLGEITPPAWAHAPPARGSASTEEHWHRAALALSRTALATSDLEESRGFAGLLAVTGLQAFSSPPPDERESEPKPARAFRIPQRPPAAGDAGEGRRLAETFANAALTTRVPGSWPDHLLRSIPLLSMTSNQGELVASASLMSQIDQDPARGPLGAWITAECCAGLGMPEWARPMAEAGREDLSAARFVTDCEMLLGSPSDEARGAGARRIVASWRSLYRRALAADDPLLTDVERASILALFEGASLEDDRSIWEAGLTALWNELLRTVIERRLDALAAE